MTPSAFLPGDLDEFVLNGAVAEEEGLLHAAVRAWR